MPLPAAAGDPTRSAVLGDIQKAGGIGALKKVDRSQIRDRSSAQVGGGNDTGPHGSGLPPAGVSPGGTGGGNDMASALATALAARNKKVSHSGKFCYPCPLFPHVLPLVEICSLVRLADISYKQMMRRMTTSGIRYDMVERKEKPRCMRATMRE